MASEKVRLTRIGVMSVAKYTAVFFALIGFIQGIFIALFSSLLGSFVGGVGGYGLLSVVVFPIMAAIMGFIGGAISAFLANIVLGWVGGIEIELSQ